MSSPLDISLPSHVVENSLSMSEALAPNSEHSMTKTGMPSGYEIMGSCEAGMDENANLPSDRPFQQDCGATLECGHLCPIPFHR